MGRSRETGREGDREGGDREGRRNDVVIFKPKQKNPHRTPYGVQCWIYMPVC